MATSIAAVAVRQLAKLPYEAGLALQLSLARKYKEEQLDEAGEVLLCEHNPVYTFGLRETEEHHLKSKELQKLGAQVFKTRRGGLTTFHGPGQLVCYPILNLRALKLGVRQYVRCLEETAILACAEFGIQAHTTEHTGVWVEGYKICAIGIQVSHGVAYHGLALNCSTDLSWFEHIVPCGITGGGVTSLSKLLGRTVPPSEVAPVLITALAKTAGFIPRMQDKADNAA